MANRYFNKQVAESRKPLSLGGKIMKVLKKGPGPKGPDIKKIKDESKARIREKGRGKK